MRRPAPLPTALANRPFSVADADAASVSRARLRAHDLRTPYRGIRTATPASPPADVLSACVEYAPRLADWQFFSHTTALALIGAPLPASTDPTPLHVSAHRPRREPRIRNVTGHRLQRRSPRLLAHPEGFLFESPARAWRQAGYSWPRDALVAAADHLVSPRHALCTLDELWREVDDMGDMRGRILASTLRLARVGSESPRETALRLMLLRAGLPEPDLNQDLFDDRGTFVARLDMTFRRWKVAVEYDGRQHAESTRQFELDADRWNAIAQQGWRLVRVLNHHMRGETPPRAVHGPRRPVGGGVAAASTGPTLTWRARTCPHSPPCPIWRANARDERASTGTWVARMSQLMRVWSPYSSTNWDMVWRTRGGRPGQPRFCFSRIRSSASIAPMMALRCVWLRFGASCTP